MNLVTGATGLLGSHIVEQLHKRGRPVRALVRRSSDITWLETLPVEIVYGDVTDPASIERAMQGVQTVYHAAARVGDWGAWHEFQSITIDGTANMIHAAERVGVDRFVHISSISVYGYVDGEGVSFDESAPLGYGLYRWAHYSRAKVQAEELIWSAQQRGKVAFTVIRPSWLYGERDRTTMGRLIRNARAGKLKLIGDGNNRLNVVHAANVAEGCILAADAERAIGEAYNCSNDGVLTQKQYFNRVAEASGAKPVSRTVPYKVVYNLAFFLECLYRLVGSKKPPLITRYTVWLIGRRCFFETHKAREQLGWKSTISYEDGIPEAVAHYLRRNGEGGDGSSKEHS
ncbi:MAG: NAD-dependent epimerase/dehydratase family protein, partial [Planctomycetes bacterium]|nr:NAD-dependent epimerase/dehydratase family protein [Planctomycetota bacterium]